MNNVKNTLENVVSQQLFYENNITKFKKYELHSRKELIKNLSIYSPINLNIVGLYYTQPDLNKTYKNGFDDNIIKLLKNKTSPFILLPNFKNNFDSYAIKCCRIYFLENSILLESFGFLERNSEIQTIMFNHFKTQNYEHDIFENLNPFNEKIDNFKSLDNLNSTNYKFNSKNIFVIDNKDKIIEILENAIPINIFLQKNIQDIVWRRNGRIEFKINLLPDEKLKETIQRKKMAKQLSKSFETQTDLYI